MRRLPWFEDFNDYAPRPTAVAEDPPAPPDAPPDPRMEAWTEGFLAGAAPPAPPPPARAGTSPRN